MYKGEGTYTLCICNGNSENKVRCHSYPEIYHIWQLSSFCAAYMNHNASCTGCIMIEFITYTNIYLHSQSVFVSTNRWVHMLKGMMTFRMNPRHLRGSTNSHRLYIYIVSRKMRMLKAHQHSSSTWSRSSRLKLYGPNTVESFLVATWLQECALSSA